jgi:hypothetical protein
MKSVNLTYWQTELDWVENNLCSGRIVVENWCDSHVVIFWFTAMKMGDRKRSESRTVSFTNSKTAGGMAQDFSHQGYDTVLLGLILSIMLASCSRIISAWILSLKTVTQSFKTMRTCYPVTQHHILCDLNLCLPSCEHLLSCLRHPC